MQRLTLGDGERRLQRLTLGDTGLLGGSMNVTARRRASDPANPFAAAETFFVDPRWSQAVDSVSATTSSVRTKDTLALVRDVPVAFWIRSKHVIRGTQTDSAQGTLRAAAASSSPPPLCVLVLHLLPNRDCHAAGGGGSELCCGYTADGQCDYGAADCAEGLAEYAREVVATLTLHGDAGQGEGEGEGEGSLP